MIFNITREYNVLLKVSILTIVVAVAVVVVVVVVVVLIVVVVVAMLRREKNVFRILGAGFGCPVC